ncbi:MAG: DUF2723 domain-containing protein [Candidatus Wallbacteria bacterium]|nr:DUF2723 domain-containing protein [Candidatus Wallbacteria bacterium]
MLAAALPALALYARTFCRTAYGEFDSAEFATIVPTGGVPHAPGYPLYLLFARAVQALYPGPAGAGVNFANCLLGACGAALAFTLVKRFTDDRPVALAASWTLAASFTYWYMSVVAEVYVAQAVMELLTLLALVLRRPRTFALLLGLCFANHPSSVLVAPPLVLGLLLDPVMRREARQRWPVLLALFCLPVVLYAYFPIACHFSSHPGFWVKELSIDLARPRDLIPYMTLRHYPRELYRFEPLFMLQETSYLAACLLQDFGAAGTLLGLAGLLLLARRRPAQGTALFLATAAQMGFYLAFTAVDKFTMFCPSLALFSVGIGVGEAELTARAGRGRPLLLGAFFLLPLMLAGRNFSTLDKSAYRATDDYARDVLGRVEKGAVIISGWQAATMLDYATTMLGMRPDVDVRHDGLALLAACQRIGVELGDPRGRFALEGELMGALKNGLPLYATFVGPELASSFEREAVGPIFRLRRRRAPSFFDAMPPDWPTAAKAVFGGAELLSLEMQPPVVRAGQIAKLRYRWRLRDPAALDTTIRLVVRRPGSPEPVPLGTTRFRWQLHALGMLRAKDAQAHAGSLLEETLDFTMPPPGSDTELEPGDYELAVRYGKSPASLAGAFKVLASAPAAAR